MIDRSSLTTSLQGVVHDLEEDLRLRCASVPEIGEAITTEHQRAVNMDRTQLELGQWRDGLLTQVAVGWVLSSVFVRFCEDNGLLPEPLLSGPGDRRRRAEDGQTLFFRDHPSAGERDFLTWVFEQAAAQHGLAEVLGPHNPVWRFGPSDDACRGLLGFWRAQDPETGELIRNFTDPDLDTRFLGDLYQDLSESARKTYALLQTPDFIEEFILDRTLDPAIDEFGLEGFRMIDPACGSGHFLLGSFARLFDRWQVRSPELGARALAEKALSSVHGVDLNPFAVAIARFRLLVAALRASGVRTLAEAPVFSLQVATGDSLLHGPAPGQLSIRGVDEQDPATRHLFETEDGEEVNRLLGQRYHAVVANPPYPPPGDGAANVAYRRRYKTCHKGYALTVPFMERLFDLAERGGQGRVAGYVGQITANSFMSRDFGKKCIEDFLAKEVALSLIVDTSLLNIGGHGTSTVILVGQNARPTRETIRVAAAIEGDLLARDNPQTSQVWLSIIDYLDTPGYESRYLSVDDVSRERFNRHPWSLSTGVAAALKIVIEAAADKRLKDVVPYVGYSGQTNADPVFVRPSAAYARQSLPQTLRRPWVMGDGVRDFSIRSPDDVAFPYSADRLLTEAELSVEFHRQFWPCRTTLWSRATFSKRTYREEGRSWWEWHQLSLGRTAPPSISFPNVATHNHFAIDTVGMLFNRSAPFFKPHDQEQGWRLLTLLNSSTCCYWLKQVSYCKGVGGVNEGFKAEAYERFYSFDGTKLLEMPVVDGVIVSFAERMSDLSAVRRRSEPTELVAMRPPTRTELDGARREWLVQGAEMVSLQEEMDWHCYSLYGITTEDLSNGLGNAPPLSKGERSFEIVLARRLAAGEVETSWFERHGSAPTTELPDHWPDDYRALVERRIELIESDRFINLLERPEYKRRWNWEPWEALEQRALRGWLLDRLEDEGLWAAGQPMSVAQLADRLRTHEDFVSVAELYAKTPELDLTELIGELVASDAVPYLAAWRYTDSGLRKRAEWESTWDLQRREDAGEDVGRIPVPPKYGKGDFTSTVAWNLRGKLDVPKERFISYPGLSREADPTLVIGWAGWDHLEQAKALAAWYEARRTGDGWGPERLVPALAGLAELVPWVRQWHNEPDPASGQRLGDFFDQFVTAQCTTLGVARDSLTDWRPPAKTRGRKKKT